MNLRRSARSNHPQAQPVVLENQACRFRYFKWKSGVLPKN